MWTQTTQMWTIFNANVDCFQRKCGLCNERKKKHALTFFIGYEITITHV
jgi:hypothetical protein